jgi:hypothetical protein
MFLSHTAEIESFNGMRTALYAPKQFGRSFVYQEVLGEIAVIDHNHHVSRPFMSNIDGKLRMRRKFVRRTGKFIATPCKEAKSYR